MIKVTSRSMPSEPKRDTDETAAEGGELERVVVEDEGTDDEADGEDDDGAK